MMYLLLHCPNPLIQSRPHCRCKSDPLRRLVAVKVWTDPVEAPHLHQAQENRIVPLIFGARVDTFIHSNSTPPQSIIVVTLYESVIPPLLKICVCH